MKKIPVYCMILLLIQNVCSAQSKPELPIDFFDHFSYSLPVNFNPDDSLQLEKELTKIAGELMKLQETASGNYSIRDSTEWYYFLDYRAGLQSFLGHYRQANNTIEQCRLLKPSPAYSIPYRLVFVAYNNACLLQKDDHSEAFIKTFATALNREYSLLDPVFRLDIINQQKGSYNVGSEGISRTNLKRIFEQAIKANNNKLDYSAAYAAINLFQAYKLRKDFQPVFEKVLYAISPARVEEINTKITMRDGVKLNCYIYTDKANPEKLPAIISLSPYPSGNEANKGNVFVTNGYVYVYVDNRGRRESEGVFFPYENDARDFYDVIDWVSKQPWCNGKVATSGGSYLGFDQWQAIKKATRHPALKAINPMVSVGFGIDFPRISNSFYPYILQWAVFVSGKELNQALFNDSKFWNDKNYELYKNRIPFAKLDSVAGKPNPYFQKWVSHPDFDNYWQNILPSRQDYEAIDIPVFTITGYYDADQLGAMYYYNQHQKFGTPKAVNEHYLLIGPYDHGGSQWQPGALQNGIDIEKEAQVPIYKYVIWWFDWVLKGKPKPAFLKGKINYFETGNHQWKSTASFKELTTDSLELYLSPAVVRNDRRKDLHLLDLKKPVTGNSLKYTHDISQALDSSFLFALPKAYDDSLYMTSPYNLVFESAPLQNDIVISNKIISRIYAILNVPDADFSVAIQEISEDGKDRSLAAGQLRVRYRNESDKPQLATPGEVVALNFEDVYIYVKKVNKGSKIRLVFQSVNNPWAEKNYGFGGIVSKESSKIPRIIEATILMSAKYPSKLMLPVTFQ